MKLLIAVLLIAFGAAFANAQKKDPILVGSRSNKHPATAARSVGPGAVEAALSRKSTTATDLAKIEHGPANQPNASKPATTHSSAAAKNFGVGQDNKNKRINASKPGGARHAVHPNPKTKVG